MDYDDQLELTQLLEDAPTPGSKRVAIIMGRFNPPTRGHYALIHEAKKFIEKNPKLNLEPFPVVMVIGGSKADADKQRNPLSVDDRILFMKNSGLLNGYPVLSASNAFTALVTARENDFEPIAVAAGQDRIDDYIRILDKNFKTADDQPIKHHKIVLSRDEEAIETKALDKEKNMEFFLDKLKTTGALDVKDISASLARHCAKIDDPTSFAYVVGLEKNKAAATKMFKKVKAAMSELPAEEPKKAKK